MFHALDTLKSFLGSYGLAIIAITVLIRAVLWPLNSAQARSMKKMQELQPKLKELQEKHKDDPAKMQEALMSFYATNKFNPFAGCLPMLVQLPIFIALYGTLNSPMFMAQAGNESFLFIDKLYHNLHDLGGKPLDGQFTVESSSTFSADKKVVLRLKTGQSIERDLQDPHKNLVATPTPVIPGEPQQFMLRLTDLGLSEDWSQRVDSATVKVINNSSKEMEAVTMRPDQYGRLKGEEKTVLGKGHYNMDVIALILIYGVLTLAYQKVMERGMKTQPEGPQASMMKFMPLMFVALLFIIPIPAGVLLYLVVTMLMMFAQTLYIQLKDNKDDKPGQVEKPAKKVIDIRADKA
jgi:YidC/Oxa1 family membrane protein insertase